MGKKGLVTSIFSKLVETSPASSPGAGGGQGSPPSWPWPSCRNNPQTTSFRVDDGDEDPCCTRRTTGPGGARMTGRLQLRGAAAGEMYKTVNSVYFDSAVDDYFSLDGGEDEKEEKAEDVLDDESCFSTTTASEEWSEAVIRSLSRSTSTHRFFFDPGPPAINSILPAITASPPASSTTTPPAEPPPKEPATAAPDPEPDLDDDGKKQQPACTSKSLAEGTVAVAVDSSDPFGDFRASMEEMVAAHGLRDWAALEELLSWYLRVNGKHNHPLIVGAFVDLLIGLASSTAATTTTTTATTSSSGGKSTKSSITSVTTATATTSTAMERCGGGANGVSCSSSSSSCATPDSQDAAEEKASGDRSSDDHHIRRGECEHQCRST